MDDEQKTFHLYTTRDEVSLIYRKIWQICFNEKIHWDAIFKSWNSWIKTNSSFIHFLWKVLGIMNNSYFVWKTFLIIKFITEFHLNGIALKHTKKYPKRLKLPFFVKN